MASRLRANSSEPVFAPRAGSAVNGSFSFSLAPATQAAVPIAYAVGEGGYTGS